MSTAKRYFWKAWYRPIWRGRLKDLTWGEAISYAVIGLVMLIPGSPYLGV